MKSSIRKSLIVIMSFIVIILGGYQYFEIENVDAENRSLITGKIIEEKEVVITPGVNEQKIHLINERGQQRFSMLSVDLQDENLSIVSSVAHEKYPGLQSLTGQAGQVSKQDTVAVGGINADFFNTSTGEVIGLFIKNGELLNVGSRPAFGITSNGEAVIGEQEIIHQAIIDDNSFTISGTNKSRELDELVLYSHVYGDSTGTNQTGVEIVLDELVGNMDEFGSVLGTVKEINEDSGDSKLEKDTVVLSGEGMAEEFLLENFKIGDEVEIRLGFDEPWSDVVEAVGGNLILVDEGNQVKQVDNDFNNAVAPRTAIGIKEDKSVFFLVIDGRNPGYSEGVTIHELAEIMFNLGAIQSINLDGGGSSTLVSRQLGDELVSVANSPSDNSDGSEREIANGLFIVTSAPVGELTKLAVTSSSELILAKSRISFEAHGLDYAHHPIKIEHPITWSSSAGHGEISDDGMYTAGESAGIIEINASSGIAKGNARIEVIDEIDEIRLPQSALTLKRGEELNLVAKVTKNDREVFANQDLFNWVVEGDIGTISDEGVFTASNQTATGKITVAYGDVKDTMLIEVGKPPIILEDFETGIGNWTYSGANYRSIDIRQTSYPEITRFGKHALQIDYDFTDMPGTSGVYAHTTDKITLEGYPEAIGMWVYGDGNRHWIRSQLRDGDNNPFPIDFVKEADWTGWKYIEAPIPSGKKTPLELDLAFRYMEVNSDNKNAGTIYVDNIRAVYGETEDDLIAPVLSELKPANNEIVTMENVEISAIATDEINGTGINPEKIEMKINDDLVKPNFNVSTGKISYNASEGFVEGNHSVQLIIQDKFGNLTEKTWSFVVDSKFNEGGDKEEENDSGKENGTEEKNGTDEVSDNEEGNGNEEGKPSSDSDTVNKYNDMSKLPTTFSNIYNIMAIGIILLLIGVLVALRMRKHELN